jgi:hypothetical protein
MLYLLKFLFQATYPMDYGLREITYNAFVQGSSWHWPLQGRQTHTIPKRLRKKKKPSVRFWMEVNNGKSRF